MNILLVNDDGINASRLKKTEDILKKFGDLTVVAPKEQQSGKSIAISIGGFPYEKIDEKHYAIEGSPADCVLFGKYGLGLDIDIVFSGVNEGYNLGVDTMYSGTVGAAYQANYHNMNAVALSAHHEGDTVLVNDLNQIIDYIFKNKIYSQDYVVNVNFPKEHFVSSKGILNTKTYFLSYDLKTSLQDGKFYIQREIINEKVPSDSDIYAINNGYISVSKIKNENSIE